MMDDTRLFGISPAYPDVALAREPSLIQCAREAYDLPSDWDWVNLEAKGEKATGHTLITGGVYKTRFLRGPRKGELDRKKPEPGTHRTISVPVVMLKEWLLRWERETGFCSNCSGSGFASAGWSKEKGDAYRICKKCGHTGIAPHLRSSEAA